MQITKKVLYFCSENFKNMQFKKANTDDLPIISELASKIWKVHYPAIIGQEQVDYMLAKMYSLESLTIQMIEQNHSFYLLEVEQTAQAYCSVSTDNRRDYFINKFYVDTERQRAGYGKAFLDYLQLAVAAHSLSLAVNRKNVQAINFYFKNGFTIERCADFDIGEGYYMNDFIMRKRCK